MPETTPQHATPAAAVPSATEQRPYDRRQHLFKELLSHGDLLLKNRLEVRHIMTRELVTISPQTTLEEMNFLLLQHRLHHLLVCSRAGEIVGIISDRDLHAPRGATAQQLMSFPVRTIASDTPLSPAITYLINESISCLPVVDNGRLCGVLTTTDLVLTLQSMLQLWMRLAQVLQQDSAWTKALDKVTATLEGDLTAAQLAERVAAARQLIRQQVQDVVNAVDLRTEVLTDMSNQRGLDDVLAMFLAIHRRYQQPFCLVVAVIDHFQRIRTSCGDDVAKPLARAVASLLTGAIRDSDFVAHYRADAFAVVMPQTGLDEANAFCSRLRDAARQNRGLDVELRISASAVSPEPGENVEQILARAEAVAAG